MRDATNIKWSLEEVTAERAKNDLEKGSKNRAVYRTLVQFFYNQMKKGKWFLTPEPIMYNEKGQLIDGQHRLHALVKYGKPLRFWVAHKVPQELFKYLNQGKSRTGFDSLTSAGYKNASTLAPVVRMIFVLTNQFFKRKQRISNDEILETLEELYDLPEYVDSMRELISKSGYKKLYPISLSCALYYIWGKESWDFWANFYTGLNLSADDPITAFRNRMLESMNSTTMKFNQEAKIRLASKAWLYYTKNKKINRLTLAKGEGMRIDLQHFNEHKILLEKSDATV